MDMVEDGVLRIGVSWCLSPEPLHESASRVGNRNPIATSHLPRIEPFALDEREKIRRMGRWGLVLRTTVTRHRSAFECVDDLDCPGSRAPPFMPRCLPAKHRLRLHVRAVDDCADHPAGEENLVYVPNEPIELLVWDRLDAAEVWVLRA